MSDPHTGEGEPNPTDPAVAAVIARKAACLVGRAGFRPQDREDIVQELTLRVLEKMGGFVPGRGKRLAFVQRLIDRFAINILRHRGAAKRDGGPHAPLTESIPAPPDDVAHRLALDQMLATLPPDLHAVAESRLAGRTVTETAEILGLSRSAVHARLRALRSRAEFIALLPET